MKIKIKKWYWQDALPDNMGSSDNRCGGWVSRPYEGRGAEYRAATAAENAALNSVSGLWEEHVAVFGARLDAAID
jgi:hypothetical protein